MKPSSTTRRRALGVAAAAAAALVIGACAPEAPPSTTTPTSSTSTTSTTVATNPVKAVSNASLVWTISQEANNAAFAPGQYNFWNAGTTPATNDATYLATNGDITVQKKNAAGTYVNIGSESAVSYANRGKNGNGSTVTATGATKLDQRILLTGGEGTVNTTTGAATIEWDGAFTINFYGTFVPFQIIDPVLTVDAAGNGKLTASATGIAKDAENPDAPGTPIPATAVTLADIPNVYGSGTRTTGFTNAATSYLDTAVTVPGSVTPQAAKTGANQAFWGSWPQSFVDFQVVTGASSYFYTSAGSVDHFKPQAPVSVAYNLAP